MARNLAFFARLLKENPIPTDLEALQAEARKVSRAEKHLPPRE